MTAPDLVVIGAGAAGLGAAREGRRRGASVLLVTDGEPGGDCTFTGCVPSKALIAASVTGASFATAAARVRAAVSAVAATEASEVLRGEGITVVSGRARFRGPGAVEIDGRAVAAPAVVVATGSHPAAPPIPGLERVQYLTNETFFDLETAPDSLIVLGGGAIGCELAQACAGFGTRVTVVEAADRILPGEDPDAAAVIAAALSRAGLHLCCASAVSAIEPDAGPGVGGVRVRLAAGRSLCAQRLLVATGRQAATAGLDLHRIGARLDPRGFLRTDVRLRAAPGVWAAGDVTGRALLTHAADEMGRRAAANALGRVPRPWRPAGIPRTVFTSPELAQVGCTLDDAPSAARVAQLPLEAFDRAITDGATDGFVRLIAAPRRLLGTIGGGRLIGATIVAPRAGEMLAEPALALATGMFTGRLAATMHAYPTWNTAIQMTAAQFFVDIGGRRAVPVRQAQTSPARLRPAQR